MGHGMNSNSPQSKTWNPMSRGTRVKVDAGSCTYLAKGTMDPETWQKYGAPHEVWTNVSVIRDTDGSLRAEFEITWFNKTATQMAEASFVSFMPSVPSPNVNGHWTMDVLGWPVSPLDVVANGTRHLHAVGEGVNYAADDTKVALSSLDVPLVCP